MNKAELVPGSVCEREYVCVGKDFGIQCSCQCRKLRVWCGDTRKSSRLSSISPFCSVPPPTDSVHTISFTFIIYVPRVKPVCSIPLCLHPSAELGTQPSSHEVNRRGEQKPCLCEQAYLSRIRMEGPVSSIFVRLSQSPPFKSDLILDIKKSLSAFILDPVPNIQDRNGRSFILNHSVWGLAIVRNLPL